jgi:hypothetical protein
MTAAPSANDEADDHSGRHPDALYKTEEEIAALIGLGVDKWRDIAHVLEKSGLPRRDPLFGKRRYWPAVRAFLDRRYGLGVAHPLVPDGKENFGQTSRRRSALTQNL